VGRNIVVGAVKRCSWLVSAAARVALQLRVVHPAVGRHNGLAWRVRAYRPELPMSLAVWFRAFPFILLCGLLGCAPGRDQFPPICPRPGLPAVTGDVSAYRPGASGEHLTDLLYSGRMMGIQGQCKLDPDDKYKLDTTVQFAIELTRGPALRGRQAHVPVYLALTEGSQILDKRVILLHAAFPPNVDRINITTGELEMLLPISATKSGAAYSVLAGFQLTPQQWAVERAKAGQ
jgi:hypothetical protein